MTPVKHLCGARAVVRSLAVTLCALTVTSVFAQGMGTPETPAVTRGAEWVSAPVSPTRLTVDMRLLPRVPAWKPGDPIVEIPRQFFGDPNAPIPVPVNPTATTDPLVELQRSHQPATTQGGGFSTPLVNINVLGSGAQPNDPTGDIGTLQFVAAINGSGGGNLAVYNKATGAQVIGPTLISSLNNTGGGACASGLGDPIVLFDELANRWLITEFSTQAGRSLCVYISDVADLSGTVTWTRYAFQLPSFPDYPKYGLWPDAYYVGANEGGTSGQRPFYAMDRLRMLAGQPATLQRLTVPNLAGFGFQMTQPADLSGTDLPPAGSPGIFMRHRDDEAHNAGSNNPTQDFLEMFEFRVDWTTPANSSITGPVSIAIPEFSSNLNGLSAFQAFPQPSGQRLDPLRETVMHRLAYRNLGSYEVLVGNLVTDLFLGAGSTFLDDTGAIRWFELRRQRNPEIIFADGYGDAGASAQGSWTVHQVGTFAPADGTPAEQADRWMAASNIDSSGNIALAYNTVRQAPGIFAGLRYTGRLQGDASGVMTAPETQIVAGTGSVSGERWGDYNDMGVDPVDGCTFWFVGNYALGTARTNRAVSFRHDECGTPSFSLSTTPTEVGVCANSPAPTNAPPITVNVGSVNGYTTPVALTLLPPPFGIAGTFSPPVVTPSGTSTLQLSATGATVPGDRVVTVRGTSGSIIKDRNVTLDVATAVASAPLLTAPANAAVGVATQPTFTWTAATQAQGYLVEASTSSGFGTLLFSQATVGTSLVSPVTLPASTQVFWRVRATNQCGVGQNSAVFSFTTAAEFCRSPALAIPDNNATGATDELVIPAGANLSDLNVLVQIGHTWPGDLDLVLTRVGTPNTVVNIGTRLGGTGCQIDNVDVTLDDEAAGPIVCGASPPGISGVRRPTSALTPFDGQSLAGTWRLTVIDRAGQDTGTLTRWCLLPAQ